MRRVSFSEDLYDVEDAMSLNSEDDDLGSDNDGEGDGPIVNFADLISVDTDDDYDSDDDDDDDDEEEEEEDNVELEFASGSAHTPTRTYSLANDDNKDDDDDDDESEDAKERKPHNLRSRSPLGSKHEMSKTKKSRSLSPQGTRKSKGDSLEDDWGGRTSHSAPLTLLDDDDDSSSHVNCFADDSDDDESFGPPRPVSPVVRSRSSGRRPRSSRSPPSRSVSPARRCTSSSSGRPRSISPARRCKSAGTCRNNDKESPKRGRASSHSPDRTRSRSPMANRDELEGGRSNHGGTWLKCVEEQKKKRGSRSLSPKRTNSKKKSRSLSPQTKNKAEPLEREWKTCHSAPFMLDDSSTDSDGFAGESDDDCTEEVDLFDFKDAFPGMDKKDIWKKPKKKPNNSKKESPKAKAPPKTSDDDGSEEPARRSVLPAFLAASKNATGHESFSTTTTDTQSLSTVAEVIEGRRAVHHFEKLAAIKPHAGPKHTASKGRRKTQLKFGSRRRLTIRKDDEDNNGNDEKKETEPIHEEDCSVSDDQSVSTLEGGTDKKKKLKKKKGRISLELKKLGRKKSGGTNGEKDALGNDCQVDEEKKGSKSKTVTRAISKGMKRMSVRNLYTKRNSSSSSSQTFNFSFSSSDLPEVRESDDEESPIKRSSRTKAMKKSIGKSLRRMTSVRGKTV